MIEYHRFKAVPPGVSFAIKDTRLLPDRFFFAVDRDHPVSCDFGQPGCFAVAYPVVSIPTPWDGAVAGHDVMNDQLIHMTLYPIAPSLVPEMIKKGLHTALRETVVITRHNVPRNLLK